MRFAAVTASALLLLVGGSTAAGGNPWNLRCPQMPAEAPVPAALHVQVHRAFLWVPAKEAGAIHVGPIWLFALSSHTNIARDGDRMDPSGRYLHRSLVAIGPTYPGQVTIRGHRVGRAGRRMQLRFTRGTTRCHVFGPTWCARWPLKETTTLTLHAGKGWRVVRTEMAIGRTGCYEL